MSMPASGGMHMIESNWESSESSIRDSRFQIAGWFTICVGIFEIPLFIRLLPVAIHP
jgi:hypothetical protein